MVIICGSLISMMESQVLAYNSPLYGRRTAQIRLKQITFEYYKEFFSSRSDNELIERYAVTGGVPKYIELFTDESDIYNAIYNNILSKSGYLYDEPNFLLRQEVTEVGRYWNSKTEIDICALDPEGKNIIVGECKYWKDKMCVNVDGIVRNVNCAIMCVSNEPCQTKE